MQIIKIIGMAEQIGKINFKKNKFWQNKKILVTGGKGFVGSYVVENLLKKRNISKSQIIIPDRKKHDLKDFNSTKDLMKNVNIVLHLAADVGGIGYSSAHPATQMRNCLLIDLNVFEAAAEEKVEKLVCVSSAVAYPVDTSSPLREENLFLGEPAKGGYGYGFAKRMAVILSRAYNQERKLNSCILLLTNTYGPRDNFDLENGHVIPSLIRKCLTQKKLLVWGDGNQIRDFIYVEDFAESVVLAAEKLSTTEPVNIGFGQGVSIKELINVIIKSTNFQGKVIFDKSKPAGQKIRILDTKKAIKLMGFSPSYSLEEGIFKTVEWYKIHASNNSH